VWLEPVAGQGAAAAVAEKGSAAPSAAAATSDPSARNDAAATEVTIELRQTLNGFLARLGGYMVRRAAAATLEEALDGLERISG
jgi:hypothetical protein